MKHWIALLTLAIVATLAFAACGSGESAAAKFEKQRYQELANAQYDQAWETLHPAQQAVVSKDAFVACGQKTTPDASTKIEVKSEKDEQLDVPQIGPSSVHSVAVTLRFGDKLRTPTDNLIKVDGKWRWTLNQATIDAFKAGGCPR